MQNNNHIFKKSAVCVALTSALYLPSMAAQAEQAANKAGATAGIERIQVTATRRASSVQEAPLNITALDGDVLDDQNISELSDVARWVPGLSIPDQGGRQASPIIVRGLNTNSAGPGQDGGTVATYMGEIPLFVDMKLIDVERVEVLIGPQGTLYGAGTLGGAIRYIPNKPELDETSGKVYGDVSSMSQSDSMGSEAGFVFNTPLVEDVLGVRVAMNYLNDPGYVDYNYVVRESGVSLAEPDWSNEQQVAGNLRKVEDANGEDTLTARATLRWAPNEVVDAKLSYFYQKQDVEGRSIVHGNSLAESNPLSGHIGQYDSAYRYLEPREKEDSLLSLEVSADLGFAELVSATGQSKFDALGQRDQSDLLIRLDYGYEEFPAFSAFTREVDEKDVFTQEIRLVSQNDSALSWIVGGFYNKIEDSGDSREYTPGFDEFVINEGWGDGNLRPDSLEYISVSHEETTEKALFGELSYQATDALSITFGARMYKYEVKAKSAIDFPLANSVYGGEPSDALSLEFKDQAVKDDGNLLKLNVSYQFSDDVMGYVTASEGFRIGGYNGVGECPDNVAELDKQIVCALPDELIYGADTTTNYELGFKSTWMSNRLHFNAAVFQVEWDEAQIGGATVYGQQPITTNAGTAESKGLEISSRAVLTDNIKAYATYAYTQAELTSDVAELFKSVGEPGSAIQDYYDGKDGDRLPGSPEQQFSLGVSYSQEVFGDKMLDVHYGLTYQSDVLTKVGARADGEALPGYALSNLTAKISGESWTVSLYANNLFDKYAVSSVRRDRGDIGLAQFAEQNANGTEIQRNYGHYLITPRTIGLRFDYLFDI